MKSLSIIEPLESRIAPAGVAALVKGGTLLIKGAQATTLVIDHLVSGEWYVTDDGTALGPFEGVRALDVRLSGPFSVVDLVLASSFEGKSTFLLTSGDDTVTVRNANVAGVTGGPLVFDSGSGDDRFYLAGRALDDGLSFGAVSVKAGSGNDQVYLGFQESNTVRSATLSGVEIASVGGPVTGNVSIDNRLNSQPTVAGFSSPLGVGGSLEYKGGAVGDTLTMAGGVGATGLKVDLGDGVNAMILGAATYAGLSLKSGNGEDSLTVTGATFSGALSAKFGGGENAVKLDTSTFAKAVVVKTGSDLDGVEVVNSTVNGAFSASTGDGESDVSLVLSNFTKAVTVKGGSGYDSVDLSGPNVSGLLSITAGDGPNYIYFSNGVAALAGVSLRGGAGDDRITFNDFTTVTGNFAVSLGNGLNDLRFGPQNPRLEITGSFTYTGGSGSDTLVSLGLSFAVGGALKVTLGDGTNNFETGGDLDGRSISITGGRGTDIIYVDCQADTATLTVTTGAGDDTVQIFGGYRTGTLNGGAGTDTLLGMPPAVLKRIGFEAGI